MVRLGGGEVLANVVASQIALHANYGGVVPELASREHLKNIVPVVRAALREAGVAFADLDAIAVTEGPGLAGALLVGITYAKALALGLDKPLIAVNHLEGHIHAVLMEARQKERMLEMPLLALVVSGGHTHLYLAEEAHQVWRYRNVGRTVDDAAGEAFDKVAKLLGLGYPGGPWMDGLATHGNPSAVEFRFQPIKIRGTHAEGESLSAQNFSFSGIKTAVLRYVQSHGMQQQVETRRAAVTAALREKPALRAAEALELLPWLFDAETLDLIASFQHAVVGNLLRQTWAAAEAFERARSRRVRRCCSQQRIAPAVRGGGGAARCACGVPNAGHVDRQRRHDRRSGVAEVRRRRVCRGRPGGDTAVTAGLGGL